MAFIECPFVAIKIDIYFSTRSHGPAMERGRTYKSISIGNSMRRWRRAGKISDKKPNRQYLPLSSVTYYLLLVCSVVPPIHNANVYKCGIRSSLLYHWHVRARRKNTKVRREAASFTQRTHSHMLKTANVIGSMSRRTAHSPYNVRT